MRIFDLLKLAAKTLKGRWVILPAAGITIGMFCLCFAGAVMTKVQQEKSMPCELNVASGAAKLTDAAIAEISKIPDVSAVTPLLTVPVTMKTGDYSAEFTLTGISPGYLNDDFRAGGAFPDSSVMPYIILNDAACKSFSNGKSDMWAEAESKEPDIGWLRDEFTVFLEGSKRPIISKVCGILSDKEEEQQPLTYISISCAKNLLQRGNRSLEYTGAYVRIKNIGYSVGVKKEIEALGLTVSNSGEKLQNEWDMEMKEMIYLILTGVFSLFCAAALMTAWRKISRLENREALRMLGWIGMIKKTISKISIIQVLILYLIGAFLGIIVSVSLPSFLSASEISIFTLPIPVIVILISVIISFSISLLPLIYTDNKYM